MSNSNPAKPFMRGADSRRNMGGRPKKREFNFENSRDKTLFYRYGIRLSEYNTMLEKQGGVCAICGNAETKTQSRNNNPIKNVDPLAVDHDHVTGKVRGLLCWKCNVGVMKLIDDRELLEAAAQYCGIEIRFSNIQ